jgi:hypothetical protein|tara:strand:+ start:997 stop:1215 length:219 start_codon:yes stop_codon:yes gene_type:complete
MFSTIELVITVGVILTTAFGLWVNLNNEVTKLKSRVYHLEQSDSDLKILLADISTRLQHIELLLAANQIKDK